MKYFLNILAIVLLLAFIAGAWKSALENPEYDSDLLLYTGIYYMSQGNNLEMAHERVYDYKLGTLPESAQRKLTQSENDKRCRDDAKYFGSMLPFCKVKLLYNLLVQWFTPYAGSPLLAMIFISLISYSGILLLLFFLLKKFLTIWWSSIMSICIGAFPAVLDSGRMFTPDAFSALLIFIGLMLFLFNKNFWLTIIFWLAAIACRPENILFPFVFGVYMLWKERRELKKSFSLVAIGLLSLAVYFFITRITDAYGWKLTFQHSLIDNAKSPEELQQIPLKISIYFQTLFSKILFYKVPLLFAALIFILAFFSSRNISTKSNTISLHHTFILISVVSLLKFLIHPFYDGRFFIVFYVLAFSSLAIELLPKRTIKPAIESLSN